MLSQTGVEKICMMFMNDPRRCDIYRIGDLLIKNNRMSKWFAPDGTQPAAAALNGAGGVTIRKRLKASVCGAIPGEAASLGTRPIEGCIETLTSWSATFIGVQEIEFVACGQVPVRISPDAAGGCPVARLVYG